jgi:hypothetical protein
MKVVAYRYLRQTKGLSKSEAIGRIKDYFQMIHSPQRLMGVTTQKINKSLGGSLGGSMFMGFKTEQLRILGNVAKHRSGAAAKLVGGIALWNLMRMAHDGIGLEEHFASFSAEEGTDNTPLSNLLSLTSKIYVGHNEEGGYDSLPTEALGGTFFSSPFGSTGKAVSRLTGAERSTSPLAKLLADAAGGTFEAFAGSSAIANVYTSVATGKSPSGTPTNSLRGLARLAGETFLPPLAGGTDAPRMARLFPDQDIDPQTFQKEGWSQFIKERMFGIRKSGGTPARVRGVLQLMAQLRQKADAPRTRVETDEWRDETKHFDVATGAWDPVAKTMDVEKHRAVIQQRIDDDPRYIAGPGLTQIERVSTGERVERAIKSTEHPKLLSRVNSLEVVDQLAFYNLWRQADRHPSLDWNQEVVNIITDKVLNPDHDINTLRNASNLVRAWADDTSLPDDARDKMEGWYGAILRQVNQKMTR